jgi:hypothetical protein
LFSFTGLFLVILLRRLFFLTLYQHFNPFLMIDLFLLFFILLKFGLLLFLILFFLLLLLYG